MSHEHFWPEGAIRATVLPAYTSARGHFYAAKNVSHGASLLVGRRSISVNGQVSHRSSRRFPTATGLAAWPFKLLAETSFSAATCPRPATDAATRWC